MTASSTRRVPVEDIGDVEVTVSDRGDGHPVVPRSAESQVFVTQGTGITLFLTIARSHDSVKATLLQVGTPHFFDEVAAATGGNAEHRDHRESLQEAVCRTFVNRPVARGLLPGRADFVVVATQLAEAGVPARSIRRGRFWGMRNTASRHTAPRHDLVRA